MDFGLIVGIIFGGFLIVKGISSGTNSAGSNTIGSSAGNPSITRSNPWRLPDIDSAIQTGTFKREYDSSFEKASGSTGVPFALIKAQAIRESSLDPQAYHYDNSSSGASYGLLQVEWNGADRFSKYGFPDSVLGIDGSGLYDPDTSAYLGACIIRDNLNWLKGNLRDTINAYNTGTPESGNIAPGNYVNDVLSYYSQITGATVS